MPTTARDVLDLVDEFRAVRDVADIELIRAAVRWAELHPGDVGADVVPGGMGTLTLAGEGAPAVAEECVAELALAMGLSTESGQRFLAQALELRHRLPRLWERLLTGELPVWRARRIAERTLLLRPEAADHVDRHLAPVAHRTGPIVTDRAVEDAIARFMPDLAAERARRAADGRHLTVEHHQVSLDGTSFVHGELDLADALDLDSALSRGAARLSDAGCEESLDVRRSMAAGDLARGQEALDLEPGERRGRAREIVLHVHLPADSLDGTGDDPVAGVEAGAGRVTAEQVRRWCGHPDARITVRPVIDLAACRPSSGYAVPDGLTEQVAVRDRTCVFPHCQRSARRCDADHVRPHADGGATCACNLASLCRRHHRLKTHTPWLYEVLEPGSYLWTSPMGRRWLRDQEGGTTELESLDGPRYGAPHRWLQPMPLLDPPRRRR